MNCKCGFKEGDLVEFIEQPSNSFVTGERMVVRFVSYYFGDKYCLLCGKDAGKGAWCYRFKKIKKAKLKIVDNEI